MNKKRELGIAFMRTSVIPPAAGFLATWLLDKGIKIDATWVFTVVSILLSGLYYLIFRAIEIISSKPRVKRLVGIFLGYPSEPTYE